MMPTITAIKQQLKRKNRYSVFVDGQYAFSLSESQLLEFKLVSGQEIDRSRLLALQHESGFGKILDQTYNFISFRPRSELEVRQYLVRKKCDEDTIEAAVERLKLSDFINDERFARQWVIDRRQFGLRSRRQLLVELTQKGISRQLCDDILESEIDNDEPSVIIQAIEQRRLQQRYPTEDKLINHLMTKGFSFSDVKTALRRLTED